MINVNSPMEQNVYQLIRAFFTILDTISETTLCQDPSLLQIRKAPTLLESGLVIVWIESQLPEDVLKDLLSLEVLNSLSYLLGGVQIEAEVADEVYIRFYHPSWVQN